MMLCIQLINDYKTGFKERVVSNELCKENLPDLQKRIFCPEKSGRKGCLLHVGVSLRGSEQVERK
jgi:hypothetical protein